MVRKTTNSGITEVILCPIARLTNNTVSSKAQPSTIMTMLGKKVNVAKLYIVNIAVNRYVFIPESERANLAAVNLFNRVIGGFFNLSFHR